MKTVEELTQVLCAAIDSYRLSQRPNITVMQILKALERIRFSMTERAIEHAIKQQKIKS